MEEADSGGEEITPAHIAIVDCLLRNGRVLSFKAYSIDTLPEMSSLRNTLVYINLSYNHFKVEEFILKRDQLEGRKIKFQ